METNISKEINPNKSIGEVPLYNKDAIDRINILNAMGTPVEGESPVPSVIPDSPTSWEKPIILVAVKTLNINFRFHQSFLKFWEECIKYISSMENPPFKLGYYFVNRKPTHIADTMSVNVAKVYGCTHILFIDDDVYDFNLAMLQELLKCDKDVISAVMYTSQFPYSMCTFRRYLPDHTVSEQPNRRGIFKLYEVPCICPHCKAEGNFTNFNGNWMLKFCAVCGKELIDFHIQPVDLIPFPFTLIKMSVFDRIAKPWFHCSVDFPPDSWFADRCADAGIQEYAHMLVRVNHNEIDDLNRGFRFQEGLEKMKQAKAVVEISAEQMALHERLMSEKMEEAELSSGMKDIHFIESKDSPTPLPLVPKPKETSNVQTT